MIKIYLLHTKEFYRSGHTWLIILKFLRELVSYATCKIPIAAGVLTVESDILQSDWHGSDVMATELSNVMLFNCFSLAPVPKQRRWITCYNSDFSLYRWCI